MLPDRRSIGRRLLAGLAAGLAAARLNDTTAKASETPANTVPRVVYHLSDLAKVHFVLGNMQNHITGMGGPDKVSLTLVVHGPALDYFVATKADGNVVDRTGALSIAGTKLVACGNTMKADKLALADLVSGFLIAEEGGVTRIAKLQAEGYLYIRP
jgi:intracellular sulfur oxidation DsrE/DsrF family protein